MGGSASIARQEPVALLRAQKLAQRGGGVRGQLLLLQLARVEDPRLGLPAAQLIRAVVAGDRQQPAPEGLPGVVAGEGALRPQKDLALGILGCGKVAQETTAEPRHVRIEVREELPEGPALAELGPFQAGRIASSLKASPSTLQWALRGLSRAAWPKTTAPLPSVPPRPGAGSQPWS